MKIRVKNIGAIRQAEIELGKLTIICGSNNTGKTYVTYALYGFLDYWHKTFSISVGDTYLQTLLSQGFVAINLNDFSKNAQEILNTACNEFTSNLATVYAAQKKLFDEARFEILLDDNDVKIGDEIFEQKIHLGSSGSDIFILRKELNSMELVITLLSEKNNKKIPSYVLSHTIGDALKKIVFENIFPKPFIASAERTGAAIFRNELNFARNRLIKKLSKADKEIDPLFLLKKETPDYALPVEANVEFTRQLESLSKSNSFITENYNEILSDFADIIGGEYQVNRNDELYFIPQNARVKLTMDESSSAVRSMLDIGFYLRHVAKKGDILIIDEPELNLHPENQRKVARLFVRLIHLGINIFITTHSDYIIKELNTMIMLNSQEPYIRKIATTEGYKEDELLNVEEIHVYIADTALIKLDENCRATKCKTLVKANISKEQGVEALSFDKTIDDMNRIQDAILFGGDWQHDNN